jgi:AraC-like DNA-binding protein
VSQPRSRPKRRSSKADRRRFERAVEIYLQDCYRARTVARVSELADMLERNRPTLSRTTAEIFGKPLVKVLRERQLAYAAKLLRTSPLTVDEVAAAAGFGHRSSFYRQFRLRFGRSPAQFRRATK